MFNKSLILILISCFLFLTGSANAQDKFEKAIEANHFKIKASSQDLKSMHKASTLLISCVDFRLRDETEKLMHQELGLLDDYDEVAVPGASLALVSPAHPHWKETVEDIVGILENLHHIKRIVLLDHRDCGAFKIVKGHAHTKSQALETEAHLAVMEEAKAALRAKFPHLKVYSLLLGLDGTVEQFK